MPVQVAVAQTVPLVVEGAGGGLVWGGTGGGEVHQGLVEVVEPDKGEEEGEQAASAMAALVEGEGEEEGVQLGRGVPGVLGSRLATFCTHCTEGVGLGGRERGREDEGKSATSRPLIGS